jgi:hypothetical protein
MSYLYPFSLTTFFIFTDVFQTQEKLNNPLSSAAPLLLAFESFLNSDFVTFGYICCFLCLPARIAAGCVLLSVPNASLPDADKNRSWYLASNPAKQTADRPAGL